MLEQMLVSFADYLRTNKLSIPTSAVEEAIQVLPYYDLQDRSVFQLLLQQIWIKDLEHYALYNECFTEFFFFQFKEKIQAIQQKRAEQYIDTEIIKLKEKQKKAKGVSSSHEAASWLKEQCDKKQGAVSSLFLEAVENQLNENLKERTSSFTSLKPSEINEFAEELMWSAILDNKETVVFDAIESIRKQLITTRNAVNKIKRKVETELSSGEKTVHTGMRKMIRTEIDELQDRPIQKLNHREIIFLREHLERSSLALLTRFSKLMKGTNREETINIQKTIAASLQTFGVPMNLVYQKPKIKKTKIDVLLDVSGSVIKSAEFLSLFTYLIHKQFPGQVRTFAFVGKLAETTHFYETEDMDKAIQHSLNKAEIDYRGYSNYDMAFEQYQKNYLAYVDDKTIIFILGDARNNRNDANIPAVQSLSKKAKSVIWFNPEVRRKWNQGDSVIGKYAPYCNSLQQTVTVNELMNSLEKTVEWIETNNKEVV